MSESGELYELEEAEELEVLEEQEFIPFDMPCYEQWKQTYSKSPIPCVILDRNLKIYWRNQSYSEHFDLLNAEPATYLTKAFYPYLGEEKVKEIYQTVRSLEKGFTWQGRVETREKDKPTVIANLMLNPIVNPEINQPIAFIGIFDITTQENKSLLKNTFKSLLEASKLKDNDTGNHIERVSSYSKIIAETLFSDPRYAEIDMTFIEDISFLAAMHDVGKIGTPDDILNKSGPLEKWEWEIMREHTINGAYILSTYPNPMAKDIALFHHEWWNGSGYPYGLTGSMIPLAARIVAITDVYDALRMKRSYKEPFTHEEARQELVKGSGIHFDPDLIEEFLALEHRFAEIFSTLSDENT